LTIIPNNAFENLMSLNAIDIELQLNDNKIHTVESNAFNGIANATTSLQLQNNNLTTLPVAVRHMFNLKKLDIHDNPLHSLDASVMSNIGRSLTYFSLDLGHFNEWPQELHYLLVLKSLTLNNIPFFSFRYQCFPWIRKDSFRTYY
jgi:Leucine-rich repeat (LRR) protein